MRSSRSFTHGHSLPTLSKSFRGLMTYKMEVFGIEGLITAIVMLIVPFVILTVLVKLLPLRRLEEPVPTATS